MKLTTISSTVLDNFRVPLAMGVLMSHAYVGLMALNNVTDPTSWEDKLSFYLLKFFTESMPPLVVPGFFLLSGYLFFLKWKETDGHKVWDWTVYKQKLQKRVFSLLIPYIIWNVLPLVLGLIGALSEGLYNDSSVFESCRLYMQGKGLRIFWSFYEVGVSDINILGIPLSINTAPFNYPLYYVRDLMGICIVSPVLFWCIRNFRYYYVLALILLGIFGLLPSYPGLRSSALVYFSLGAYFSINNLDMVKVLRGKLMPCLVASWVLLYLMIIGTCPNSLRFIYVIVGLLVTIRIVDICVTKYSFNVPKNVIGSIFFFYVAHEGLYILQGIQYSVCSVIPLHSYKYVLVQYLLIICLTFVTCCLLRMIVVKRLPSFGKLLGV